MPIAAFLQSNLVSKRFGLLGSFPFLRWCKIDTKNFADLFTKMFLESAWLVFGIPMGAKGGAYGEVKLQWLIFLRGRRECFNGQLGFGNLIHGDIYKVDQVPLI